MKAKTHQATAKRIRISKTAKVLVRRAGQDHFNARESGRITVRKRRDQTLSKANRRALRSLIPRLTKQS